MPGKVAWQRLKQEPRLVSSTACHLSGVIFCSVPSRVIPALFTRMSMGPSSSSICATPASQAAKSLTSHL